MPTKLTPHEPRSEKEAAIYAILTAPLETDDDYKALIHLVDDPEGEEWIDSDD